MSEFVNNTNNARSFPNIYRGEIYWVDFGDGVGGEQSGVRPALIVQNNTGNRHSPTTVVIPMTTKKGRLPVHVDMSVEFNYNNYEFQSTSLCEQIRTISKTRIVPDSNGNIRPICYISDYTMSLIEQAVALELGMFQNVGTNKAV